MIRSLWFKFFILLLSVSLISLSAALILRQMIINDFNEYLEGEQEDRIYRIMAVFEGSYERHSGWNPEALQENVAWALLQGYEVRISDDRKKDLMDTGKALESLPPFMKRRIAAITDFRMDSPDERQAEFSGYPLFLAGNSIGSLQIRKVSSHMDHGKEALFFERSNSFLLFSLLVVGGLSLLMSLVFSRRLTDPIKKLTSAARDISEGNIKSRVSFSGNDEISTLARTFNTMAGNLEVYENLRRKLTSNIAHELRTPLTAMQGEIEGMIDGLIKTDKEHLLSLHEETARLKKIIEGIEELSRAEASILELRKQNIALRPFLGNIKERFEKLFMDKGVVLSLRCEENLLIYADPDRISQIVINLLSNALKATESGGRVMIETGVEGTESFIRLTDTGTGIMKDDLPFVFERFYRARQGGLGLGLTIARELAEAHGGRITVQSEYGQGSIFTLYVPEFTISS
jgi:two-component system, OmpR family, sensor histidine kinase BaeS